MRIRRSLQKRYIWMLAAVLFTAVLTAACIFIIHKNKKEYESITDRTKGMLEEMKRLVYVASDDMKTGDVITEDKLYLKEIIMSEGSDIWIDEKSLNQALKVDIAKDMLITKNMIINNSLDTKGLREVYVEQMLITPNINSYDYCDIRINYPNGESYIMLAKKQVFNINEAYSACCIKLNNEEYHLLLSAVTDCREFEGSSIAITKYIHTEEEPSILSYPPSLESLALIYKETGAEGLIGKHYSPADRNELVERLKEYNNPAADISFWDD